mgnify:CR=1 FL=1
MLASVLSRLVPTSLKLEHQPVDMADQLRRVGVAQDFFDAFRNLKEVRGDFVIRQRRKRLQDVVELRRYGRNFGYVVVLFDFR